MITKFYYDKQLRKYLLQFAQIFTGLQVQHGKDKDGNMPIVNCPIHYGSIDKVVASIYSGNTQNKMLALPMLSFYMTNLDLAPERRKGVGSTHKRAFMEEGGVFPNDLKYVSRYMPIPYNMNVDLFIYASNTEQLHQILEQILMIFDPMIQIQTSDKPFDWAKLTTVELIGINNEENFPMGGDKRIINWTLSFQVPVWISPPMDVRDDLIKTIQLNIYNDNGQFTINEFDQSGNLVPFGTDLMVSITVPSSEDNPDDGDGAGV
jgi:hypothetical protein